MPDTQHGRKSVSATLLTLRSSGRRAFIPYVTAGHPSPDRTEDVLRMLADEGADLLEFGIPFSDPLADGPTIQEATWRALERGVNIDAVLRWTETFVRQTGKAVVLFSYLNPILRYGPDRFLTAARDSGAAGLLITDLPAGEDRELEETLSSSDLALVRLIAPTTSLERAENIARLARGFLYYISRTGVTGERDELRDALASEVAALRKVTELPIAVGFGISNPDQARLVASVADGVVVGSALVRTLAEDGLEGGRKLARAIRRGIDAAG